MPNKQDDIFEDEITMKKEVQSDFLTYGSQIVSIFAEESTLTGIMNRLHEESNSDTVQGIPELKHFVSIVIHNLQSRSPLALCAINSLFHKAKRANDTLETCINRERIVYKNLYKKDDYAAWVECFHNKNKGEDDGKLNWKHGSFSDVTDDEIEELFHEQ